MLDAVAWHLEAWRESVETVRGGGEKGGSLIRGFSLVAQTAGAVCFVGSFGAALLPALAGWSILEACLVFVAGQIASKVCFDSTDLLVRTTGMLHYLSLPLRGKKYKEWQQANPSNAYAAVSGGQEPVASTGGEA